MHNGKVDAASLHRIPSARRVFLISRLLIVGECMAAEISRRFADVEFVHVSAMDELHDVHVQANDLIFVDATHEDTGFDVERLLSELGDVRAIVLTPDGVLDTVGPPTASRPATLAALMALVGEAFGASEPPTGRVGAPEQSWRDLTPREREVAMLLLEGKSNKEIANELGLSDNTVKMHLTQIMRRLHVTNRTQVVLLLGSGREHHLPQPNGDPAPTDRRPAEPGPVAEARGFPASDRIGH